MNRPVTLPTTWVVTANVIKEHPFGPLGLFTKNGTKHFRGGAKVLVIDGYFGMCEHWIVLGHHRASGRYVKMVLPLERLENFRAQVAYSPTVLRLFAEHHQVPAYTCDRGSAERTAATYLRWAESKSELAHEMYLVELPSSAHLDALVMKFVGSYGVGSRGNGDATYMSAVTKAAIAFTDPFALIFDFSELTYEWGEIGRGRKRGQVRHRDSRKQRLRGLVETLPKQRACRRCDPTPQASHAFGFAKIAC